MRIALALSIALCYVGLIVPLSYAGGSDPIVDESVVFAEKDGAVAVEAEHFFRQSETDARAFI